MGLPLQITQLFMEASCVFRNYDRDFSGTLEFHEFQNAMFHLGYRMYVLHCNSDLISLSLFFLPLLIYIVTLTKCKTYSLWLIKIEVED
jgi:hypothetical protein